MDKSNGCGLGEYRFSKRQQYSTGIVLGKPAPKFGDLPRFVQEWEWRPTQAAAELPPLPGGAEREVAAEMGAGDGGNGGAALFLGVWREGSTGARGVGG